MFYTNNCVRLAVEHQVSLVTSEEKWQQKSSMLSLMDMKEMNYSKKVKEICKNSRGRLKASPKEIVEF